MAQRDPKIVYVQYTNPAGYPPLEHSSRILANQGWDVLFLGASADDMGTLNFPPHPSINVRRLPGFGGGLLQKLNYLAFINWTIAISLQYRPRWIYASDILSCPAALAIGLLTRCRIVYHEHDTPSLPRQLSLVQHVLRAARQKLARVAEICILPQEGRLSAFVAETGRHGPTLCVWNCPRREEVAPARPQRTDQSKPLTFYYHGSLNSERLPLTIVAALDRACPHAKLDIVGYETVGSRGYMAEFLGRADALGLHGRVRYLGPLSRKEMYTIAAKADVGLTFMPAHTIDINMAQMTGASNKPFDYLAAGLMLLVSDLTDWRVMFVEPGYAMACNPYDLDDLVRTMRWCIGSPEAVRSMGERGRQRILTDWNYEWCFASVAEKM